MLRCLRAGGGGEVAIRHVLVNASWPCWWHGFFRRFGIQQIQDPPAEKCWQVSSLGRVCTSRGVISYGSLKASGYRKANVEGKAFFVHRLVAFHFLGPPSSQDAWQVNHKDGNRSNNILGNLEYVTCSQNIRHALAGKRSAGRPRPVMWRHSGSSQWTTYESIRLAANNMGLSAQAVSRYCHRTTPLKGLEVCFADSMNAPAEEEWRQMRDPETGASFVGRMVSSCGRIRSLHGQVSRGHLSKDGYWITGVRASGGQKRSFLVHRLVAFAFFGDPPTPEHSHVNHKDLDRGNNAVTNLEYATPSENMNHFWLNFRARGKRRQACQTRAVESRQYASSEPWTWHASVANAATTLGLHRSLISMCINGRRRSTGNLEFRPAKGSLLPGEQWRKVDVVALLRERADRVNARPSTID